MSGLADAPELPVEELPALTRGELVSLATRLLRAHPGIPEWMCDEIRAVAKTAQIVSADWWNEFYQCGCLAGAVLQAHGIEGGQPDRAYSLMPEQRIAIRELGMDFYHKLIPEDEEVVGIGVYRIVEDKELGS